MTDTPALEHRLSALLDDLQTELQHLDLWAAQPPAPDAFLSTTPFFADTMVFSQWLQWVFIPRFRALLEGGHALPAQCNIAPLAEEALRGLDQPTEPLIELLRRFDGHF